MSRFSADRVRLIAASVFLFCLLSAGVERRVKDRKKKQKKKINWSHIVDINVICHPYLSNQFL